jgi:hypothetical protein
MYCISLHKSLTTIGNHDSKVLKPLVRIISLVSILSKYHDMATPSSPPRPSSPPLLPSHLDAITLPTSLTPALSPSPAATSPSRQPASRFPQGTAAGRSRSQRWSSDTPPSGKSGGGAPPPSFKEVLLSKPPEAPSARSLDQLESSFHPAPRILLRVADSRPSPSRRGPDADGRRVAGAGKQAFA